VSTLPSPRFPFPFNKPHVSKENPSRVVSDRGLPLLSFFVEEIAEALGASSLFVVRTSSSSPSRGRLVAIYPRSAATTEELDMPWTEDSPTSSVSVSAHSVVKLMHGAGPLLTDVTRDRFVAFPIVSTAGSVEGWVAISGWAETHKTSRIEEIASLVADLAAAVVNTVGRDVRNFVGRDISRSRRDQTASATHGDVVDTLAEDASHDGFWDWDTVTGAMRYSRRWLATAGYRRDELRGSATFWLERVHPDDRVGLLVELVAVLAGRVPRVAREHRLLHVDQSYRSVIARGLVRRDTAGQPVRFAGWLIDITRRKHIESELRQARKMDAVGRLAAGVAHDFANLVTVIRFHSDLALGSLDTDSTVREDLDLISRASARAAALTHQMLGVCRTDTDPPQTLDLNALIIDAEHMLRSLLRDRVRMITNLAPRLWRTNADATQLERVLMNVVVNARDAMREGGVLTIETRNVTTDGRHELAGDRQEWKRDYVALTITDTGHGMDADTQARAFDRFFTTKPAGQGTGLGLATVQEIVRQYDGTVQLQSELGAGTSVTIMLPRVAGADA
jgi:PAS domain S-box-containing protein